MITFKNKWKADAFKMLLRKHWKNLSNDELSDIGGDSQKLMSILQFSYGYPRKQAERKVRRFWKLHTSLCA